MIYVVISCWRGTLGRSIVETDLNRRKVIDKRKISWTWDGAAFSNKRYLNPRSVSE